MVLGSLSLQECLADSPAFRQHISKFEEHSEVLRKRMKKLSADMKAMYELERGATEASQVMAGRCAEFAAVENDDPNAIIGPDECGEPLEKFSEVLQELQSMREILNMQVREALVEGTYNARKEDFGELQKVKKLFDDSTKEYDNAWNKHQDKLAKKRHSHDGDLEATMAREARRHELAAVSYMNGINRFQKRVRFEFMERMLQYMYALQTYYHQGYEYMAELSPFMQMAAVELAAAREEYSKEADELGATYGMLEKNREDGRYGNERVGCDEELGEWRSYAAVHGAGGEGAASALLKRSPKWARIFCELRANGQLHLLGDRDGKIKDRDVIDMRDCAAAIDLEDAASAAAVPGGDALLATAAGRPYCVAVKSRNKTIIMQCDTRAEHQAWVKALVHHINRNNGTFRSPGTPAAASPAGIVGFGPADAAAPQPGQPGGQQAPAGKPAAQLPPTAAASRKKSSVMPGGKEPKRRSTQLQGKVTVEVVEASDLVAKDASSCDPYCIVSLGKTQARTRRGKKTTSPRWRQQFRFDVSDREQDVIVINVFDSQKFALNDPCLGRVAVPIAEMMEGKVKKGQYRLELKDKGSSASSGSDGGGGGGGGDANGQILLAFLYEAVSDKLTISDFTVVSMIGKGSFGKVLQVKKNDTGNIYALKIVKKSMVENDASLPEALQRERDIMLKMNHPFLMSLQFSFQTDKKVYFVLDYINGGELYHHLKTAKHFSEERSRFYAAEVMSALDYLHRMDIIYRDLKAENILLDYDGHVCLIDFGLCKTGLEDGQKTKTFCGTPDYVAPELLTKVGYGKSVDWWSLGVLVFEMLFGRPPFEAKTVQETFANILRRQIEPHLDHYAEVMPISEPARDFIMALLQRDPKRRLGNARGGDELREHAFFASIKWGRLLAKQTSPPFKPRVKNETDTSNIASKFTKQAAIDTLYVEEGELTADQQRMFKGFSYFGTAPDIAKPPKPTARPADYQSLLLRSNSVSVPERDDDA